MFPCGMNVPATVAHANGHYLQLHLYPACQSGVLCGMALPPPWHVLRLSSGLCAPPTLTVCAPSSVSTAVDGSSPCMAQSCLCSLMPTCSGLHWLFPISPAEAGGSRDLECPLTYSESVNLQWVLGPHHSNATPPNTPLQQPSSPNQAPHSHPMPNSN